MSDFDSSQERFESVAGQAGKLEQFRRGSWWAAFQLTGPLPWQTFQEFRNLLGEFSDGPFGWSEGKVSEDKSKGIVSAWFPTDNKTSRYWQMSSAGFAFCRETFGEDVTGIPGVPPHKKPYASLLLRKPSRIAAAVLDHAANFGQLIEIQMGWVGLLNRSLEDPETATYQIAFAMDKSAMSEVCWYAPSDGQNAVIRDLTKELYRTFGVVMTADEIGEWLSNGN